MTRAIVGLTAIALMAAACGGADSASDTTTPSDPDAVLLTVTSEGGFIPVEFNLERMPRFVLTADRTLYHQGPVPLIFPGPLLPSVLVTTVSEKSYDEVMQLVEELGLADIDERIDNTGAEMVADATTEMITYYDDEGAHRLGIYALGMVEGAGSIDRVLATELIQALEGAVAAGESEPYQPETLQVAAGPALDFEDGMSSVEPWPLDVPYEDMPAWGAGWRCIEVGGEDVAALTEIFSAANQATLWDTGSEALSIKARPLLPGEEACTGAPGD